MRRLIWIIVAAAVIVGGWWGWQAIAQQRAAEAEAEAQQVETAEAFIGNLAANASASGNLQPQQRAQLALGTAGVVADVAVEVGDIVQEGAVLVRLETAALERAILNAQQTLIIQQSNLASLQLGSSAAQLEAAQAAVANAQAQLDNLLAGGADQVTAAETSLRIAQANVSGAAARLAQAQAGGSEGQRLQAQNALASAESAYLRAQEMHRSTFNCTYDPATEAYDCEGGSAAEEAMRVQVQQAYASFLTAQEQLEAIAPGGNSGGIGVAQASLAQANASLSAAQARYELALAGPTAAQIAAAEAALLQAEAQLARTAQGVTAEQIQIAEAAVAQAETAVALAEYNLSRATLAAPFGGVVTAVFVTKGELAGGVAVEMVNLESLEVVLDVDEVDIGLLSLGQPATIVIESFPDDELSGEIVAIAPKNKLGVAGGLISYEVNLSMGEHGLPLRPNMTASATLITAEQRNVLLIPNRALIINREEGTYTVQLQTDGQIVEQAVTIGLRDGRYTQITSGLVEGDVVIISAVNAPRITFGP